MATVVVFDWFLKNVFDGGVHAFGGTPNTIKCALIKSAANGGADPLVTDPDPCWGAGGSTNYQTAEVTPGGNYIAGGNVCANPAAILVAGVLEVDFDNPAAWLQDPANPTNSRWGIAYDNTAANKNAVGFIDLFSDRNMTALDLNVQWGTPFTRVNQVSI